MNPTRGYLDDSEVFVVPSVRLTMHDIVEFMRTREPSAWQTEVVRSADGSRNCFFGHLFALGEACALHAGLQPGDAEKVANALWEWFEECWATTYAIYPVNDGENPRYPQATPQERVVAYLQALRSGTEMRTQESMEQEWLLSREGR